MAIVTTDNANYFAIADAIRTKTGSIQNYRPDEMAAVIRSLETSATNDHPLQNKIVTPTKSSQTTLPDSDFYGLSSVTVEPIPDNYIDTSDANATAANILSTKTAYVNGTKVTGSMTDQGAVNQTIQPGGSYTIPNGFHNGSGVIHAADVSAPSLQSKTVTPSTATQTVNPDGGYDGLSQVTVEAIQTETKTVTPNESTQDITPAAGKYLTRVTLEPIDSKYVGSGVTRKAAQAYTLRATDQTIAANQYLSGVQTIKGDANLVSENIRSGVSIFGVLGSYKGDTTAQEYWGELTLVNNLSNGGATGMVNCGFAPDVVLLYGLSYMEMSSQLAVVFSSEVPTATTVCYESSGLWYFAATRTETGFEYELGLNDWNWGLQSVNGKWFGVYAIKYT